MTKYKVSGLVMSTLRGLRENKGIYYTVYNLLYIIDDKLTFLNDWIYGDDTANHAQTRQREQAVINYVFNGADNFEVKTPTWVIVSKKADEDGDWHFIKGESLTKVPSWAQTYKRDRNNAITNATRITDPKLKDALLYANKDFEAIEVEE